MIGPQTVNVKKDQTDQIHAIYDKAAEAIGAIIVVSFSRRVRSRPAIQAKVRAVTTQLNKDAGEFVDKNLPQYYLGGANNALQGLRANGLKPVVTKTTELDKAAIASRVTGTKAALQEASAGMARSASKVISAGMQQQIRAIVSDGRLNSQTLKQVSASVEQALKDNGITALVDKGGRDWNPGVYAEMATRTEAVAMRNEGLVNRMLANDEDLVEVSANGSTHPVCEEYEGAILSISGESTEYESVEEATGAGLFHPNCQHTMNPVDPVQGVYDDTILE